MAGVRTPPPPGGGSDADEVPRDAALNGHTEILGGLFHVDAVQVILEADCWSAVDSAYQTHLEHIYAIDGPGHLMTVRIPGHAGDYVLIIYPGQE